MASFSKAIFPVGFFAHRPICRARKKWNFWLIFSPNLVSFKPLFMGYASVLGYIILMGKSFFLGHASALKVMCIIGSTMENFP